MSVERQGRIFDYSITSLTLILIGLLLTTCGRTPQKSGLVTWEIEQDSTDRIATVDGLDGPESVRYDPGQDLFFVSNFTGGGSDRDSTGFISRVSIGGEVEELRFMKGTDRYPLHAPRGMFITGDTLWAADIDGIHGFNRITGEQLKFFDFTEFEPGFLNDIAAGPEGALYVTDTGTSKLYKISGSEVTVVADSLPHSPNGVTLSPTGKSLILAPWGGAQTFFAWIPAKDSLVEAGTIEGGNFDGIEIVDGRWIVASQADSGLHVFSGGKSWLYIKTTGQPADIGIDTQRRHVAVPYVARNEVDIWQLPTESKAITPEYKTVY